MATLDADDKTYLETTLTAAIIAAAEASTVLAKEATSAAINTAVQSALARLAQNHWKLANSLDVSAQVTKANIVGGCVVDNVLYLVNGTTVYYYTCDVNGFTLTGSPINLGTHASLPAGYTFVAWGVDWKQTSGNKFSVLGNVFNAGSAFQGIGIMIFNALGGFDYFLTDLTFAELTFVGEIYPRYCTETGQIVVYNRTANKFAILSATTGQKVSAEVSCAVSSNNASVFDSDGTYAYMSYYIASPAARHIAKFSLATGAAITDTNITTDIGGITGGCTMVQLYDGILYTSIDVNPSSKIVAMDAETMTVLNVTLSGYGSLTNGVVPQGNLVYQLCGGGGTGYDLINGAHSISSLTRQGRGLDSYLPPLAMVVGGENTMAINGSGYIPAIWPLKLGYIAILTVQEDDSTPVLSAVRVPVQSGEDIAYPLTLKASEANATTNKNTIVAAIAAIGAGNGSNLVTITITEADLTPIPDVSVTITGTGGALAALGTTNINGVLAVNLNAGDYYIYARKAGVTFTAQINLTVDGVETVSITGTPVDIGAPGAANACRVYEYLYNQDDSTKPATVTATAQITGLPVDIGGRLHIGDEIAGTYAAATGLVYWDIVKGATVRFDIEDFGKVTKTVPNSSSVRLGAIV